MLAKKATKAHRLLTDIRDEDFNTQKFEDEMYDFHRFLDWGETIDNVTCFLIPIDDVLYLTSEFRLNTYSSEERSGIVYYTKVTP